MNQETVTRTSEKQAMTFVRVQTKKKPVLASMCNKNVQLTFTNNNDLSKEQCSFLCLTHKNGVSFVRVCVCECVY